MSSQPNACMLSITERTSIFSPRAFASTNACQKPITLFVCPTGIALAGMMSVIFHPASAVFS